MPFVHELAEWNSTFDAAGVTPTAQHEAKLHLLDSVGCAFAALGEPTALEEHQEINTIKIACAHQASMEAIESIEQELGVGVMSSSLAITWQGLRQGGISDEIPGMGSLLREA